MCRGRSLSISSLCNRWVAAVAWAFSPRTLIRDVSIYLRMKLRFGYLTACEEFPADRLVSWALEAERRGFDSIWATDHFHPWVDKGGHGCQAWVVLSAIGALTKGVALGTAVTCPTLRYNPAVLAQAFATLESLCPGRVFLGVGTGEALNEVPVGCRWPMFTERLEMLEEAINVIRMLWRGGFNTYRGKYYTLNRAKIYEKPSRPIPIYIATTGPRVAELAGRYADSFMTLPMPRERYTDVLFPALEKGARKAGRDPSKIEKSILIHVSYNEDYEKALDALMFWRPTLLPVFFDLGAYDPRYIEAHGELVGREALPKYFMVATSADEAIEYLEGFVKLGFQHFGLSPSGDVTEFLRVFGERVFPYLREPHRNG